MAFFKHISDGKDLAHAHLNGTVTRLTDCFKSSLAAGLPCVRASASLDSKRHSEGQHPLRYSPWRKDIPEGDWGLRAGSWPEAAAGGHPHRDRREGRTCADGYRLFLWLKMLFGLRLCKRASVSEPLLLPKSSRASTSQVARSSVSA